MFFSCVFLLAQYFFNKFRFLVWSSQIKILYLQDLTNIDLFLTSREVEESLLRHETGPCLAWCYDNKSKLRKNKVCLKEINSFIAHTWFHIIFWMWIFIWIEDFKQWFLVCLSDFLSVCLSVGLIYPWYTDYISKIAKAMQCHFKAKVTKSEVKINFDNEIFF